MVREGLGKKMEIGCSSYRGHVLLFPFPAQGHINPALQFAKRLVSRGFKATVATTVNLFKFIHIRDCKVGFETLSDGYDETGPTGAKDGTTYLRTFQEVGSRTLTDIINKYNNESSTGRERITCLVGDSILPWVLDVGKEQGLVTACFFTMSSSVSSLFYHVHRGDLSVPVEEATVSFPGLPLLALQDMPPTLVTVEPATLGLLVNQFSNLEKADWLLFNTFDELESEILKVLRELWRVGTIGPTTPSMYLDKRVEGDTENSLNLFKPPSDGSCLKWLDTKETRSVLYISFGSIAELGEEQMEELIWGIRQSNKDFIWVLREKEQSKLPQGFTEEMLGRGLVVPWCSQLEVLAHDRIGCFLTHCGWNSTMEALSLGVPMVSMPQLWDQITNAKFVEDVWGLGIRVQKDDKGIVTREELESCIREVMDGEKGIQIRMNTTRWREAAKAAVDQGGSSDVNVEEFVASIRYT